jgi:hypothetical protein
MFCILPAKMAFRLLQANVLVSIIYVVGEDGSSVYSLTMCVFVLVYLVVSPVQRVYLGLFLDPI